MTVAETPTIAYDARGNMLSEARPTSRTVAVAYDGYGRLLSYTRARGFAADQRLQRPRRRVSVPTKPGNKAIVTLSWRHLSGRFP